MKSKIQGRFPAFLKPLMVAAIPPVLILAAVRLVLVSAPFLVSMEYNRPAFPEDPFGFSADERIYWSMVDIEYLLDSRLAIEYFDDFHLGNGDPMHNQRELSHMDDVKRLSEGFWLAGRILIVYLIISSALLWNLDSPSEVGRLLRHGARATWILMAVVLLAVLIGFGPFFVGFHRIFFEGDTWLFKYSDTFIRLYPEMFWQDVFILLAAGTAFLAGVFELTGWKLRESTSVYQFSSDDINV